MTLTADNLLVVYAVVVTLLLLVVVLYVLLRRRGISRLATERILSHLRISSEGLAIFDSRRRIIFSNSLFSQYCDFISSEYLTDTRYILQQPEFRAISRFVDSDNEEVMSEPCLGEKIEKDGRTFMLSCVRFDDGGFEISINDITQAEEQSRLKQQLTQNVAHEFKTPVCSIQGYLETIIQNYPQNLTQEQLQHFLQRCYSQSNRLHNLVGDIAQLSEMNGAIQQLNREPVNVSQLVRRIEAEISNRLSAQNMSVANSLPETLYVDGDSSKLYSIFRNLFDNAVAYAGEGVTIKVNCFRTDEEFYYFSFSDNGCGVPEEHLNRLFERFYRVDKGRSRKMGGTGLGLAIVKNAVALHGGTISVRRSREGGLEFVFTLPK